MGTIVFTGGGTAGHVIPNVALMPKLQAAGWTIEYIGSASGIEREIIESLGGVPYHVISTGKLRRYFDIKNFKDPFRVLKGIAQSHRLLRRIRPDIVFSKGGFVSVPVILASKLNGIPVIIHESDMSPGLANKISMPFATKVCVSFPETLKLVAKGKSLFTGSPIREEILQGDASNGRNKCGFHSSKPIIMVMGGSLGSKTINRKIRESLDNLLDRFQIIHICGKGNIDDNYAHRTGYRQFEYIYNDLPDYFAMADMVISRAGANAIFEFLALRKPMLLIPLTLQASRGDQLLNAASFEKMGYSRTLPEEEVSRDTFLQAVSELYDNRDDYIKRMQQSHIGNSVDRIIQLIKETKLKK